MKFNKLFKREFETLLIRFNESNLSNERFHAGRNEGDEVQKWREYRKSPLYEQNLNNWRASLAAANARVKAILEADRFDENDLAHLFAYLAMPVKIFRSGYMKEALCRRIKRENISDEQAKILEGILSEQISVAGREFKGMVSLLSLIDAKRFLGILDLLENDAPVFVKARIVRVRRLLESQ